MGSPPEAMIAAAIAASLNSPCRSKRGVAIWWPGFPTPVAVGWNDLPAGGCDGSYECKATCARRAVHAEQRAIIAADRKLGTSMLHVKTTDGVLVASGGPSCVECSKLILVTGVAWMWLYHADGWRRYDALEFHRLSLAAHNLVERVDRAKENCG